MARLPVVLLSLVAIYEASQVCAEGSIEQALIGRVRWTKRLSSVDGAASRPQGGQLESFSSETTGLGDMEGQDSLKKMIRRSVVKMADGQATPSPAMRSVELQRRLLDYFLWRKQQLQQQQQQQQQQRAASKATTSPRRVRFGRTQLKMGPSGVSLIGLRRRMGQQVQKQRRTVRSEPVRPAAAILVSRRTAETLLDKTPPANVHETRQVSAAADGATDEANFPLMGEFGSRISLLTMRKSQPGAEESTIGTSFWPTGNDNDNRWPMAAGELPAPRDGASGAEAMTKYGFISDNVDGQLDAQQVPAPPNRQDESIISDGNPNYLPRIARALW